jgi:hypothetical protein
VEKFGDIYWRKLAPGTLRSWLREHGEANGWAGAHSMYRTIRAFFGRVRLCYDRVDHPGFVSPKENPAAELDLGLPKPNLILWPRAAIDAFVALADNAGHKSIGDAVVMRAGWACESRIGCRGRQTSSIATYSPSAKRRLTTRSSYHGGLCRRDSRSSGCGPQHQAGIRGAVRLICLTSHDVRLGRKTNIPVPFPLWNIDQGH